MQATTFKPEDHPDGAVGLRGRRERLVRALAHCGTLLRSHAARWSPCEDTRYLGAAQSLEDLERRLRRLERDGAPPAGLSPP